MVLTLIFEMKAMTYVEFIESLKEGFVPLHIKGGTLPEAMQGKSPVHFTFDSGLKKTKREKYDITADPDEPDELIYVKTKSHLYQLFSVIIHKGE